MERGMLQVDFIFGCGDECLRMIETSDRQPFIYERRDRAESSTRIVGIVPVVQNSVMSPSDIICGCDLGCNFPPDRRRYRHPSLAYSMAINDLRHPECHRRVNGTGDRHLHPPSPLLSSAFHHSKAKRNRSETTEMSSAYSRYTFVVNCDQQHAV